MFITQKTIKQNSHFLKVPIYKILPKNTQRKIWVEPVNRKNKFIDTPKIIPTEAQAIIHNHQIFNNCNDPARLKTAAQKLNLIVRSNTTQDYWRGETFHAQKNIPNGIYELSKNTSITDSLTVANKFTQKGQKLYDILSLSSMSLRNSQTVTNPNLEFVKKGTILRIIVPAGVDIIKIPENHAFFLHENEYVIPAGTLVRIEKQGTHIHVLSPQDEHKARLKGI